MNPSGWWLPEQAAHHPEFEASRGEKNLAQLVEKSDILFENMRPGTLDRLGSPQKSCGRSTKA